MKALLDLSIIPLGVGVSLSSHIAVCEKILTDAGLKTRLHAHGTNIEGDLETALDAVRRCHEKLHGMGAPRVHTAITVSTRTDRDDSMDDRIRSVESKA